MESEDFYNEQTEGKNKHLKCVTFLVEVKLKHLFSCFKVFLKVCFWQGSNLRPSACEADVITTTLQKPATLEPTLIWPVEYRYQI